MALVKFFFFFLSIINILVGMRRWGKLSEGEPVLCIIGHVAASLVSTH